MPLIFISGALANKPFNGGNAWTRLSWVTGFKRLGFEVCVVEQIAADNCVDASGQPAAFENSVNLAWFRQVMEQFGLTRSASLICEAGKSVWGIPVAELTARASQASLLFNISGHLTHPEIKNRIGCKVYFDDDPGFTQFWHASGNGEARLTGHDFHFTIGANIGSPDCAIPVGDIRWCHTRTPVVLDDWPVVGTTKGTGHGVRFDRFTTVASWRGAYGAVEFAGRRYGAKAHEFRKFLELPRRTGREFEIALQIHPGDQKDLEALQTHSWRVVDPIPAAGSPEAFRRYVQSSGAEFSVAQGVYVDTNCGWFSDRTVRYLASGKPVLVQDTGFSRHLPVGEGLLAFRTLDEAIAGAERIARDYDRHCLAARRLAEEFFDSDKVISKLAAEIGLELPSLTKHEFA
jgi:hypothetical protein